MADNNNVSFLNTINAETEGVSIKVKIIRLWKQSYSNNPSTVASIDMILMDEQSNKIHATIKRNLLSYFEKLLEEGSVRIIKNFGVAENTGRFLLTTHCCKINFFRNTSVKSCAEFLPDAQVFSFMPFNDILSNNLNPVYAFDVIGELVNCEDTKVLNSKKGCDRRIKAVQLRDADGVTINCCLWDDHANTLTAFLSDPSNMGTRIIMLIQFAKIGEWEGKPQISNSMFGTKLWINDQIPEILEFKERLLTVQVDGVASDRHLSVNTIISNPQDYWTKFNFVKIDEIADITSATSCIVVATIIKIQSEHGWHYMACVKCGKKVERSCALLEDNAFEELPSVVTFDCGECGKITDVYPKIKIQIRVQDDTGSASFVLFERDVTAFIDKPASVILKKRNKLDDDLLLYPEEFDAFVNKRCAFKIRISNYNLKMNYRVYTVNKFSDDGDIIKAVMQNSGVEEIPSQDDVDLLTTGLPLAAATSKDAVSMTGENATPNELLKSTATSPASKKRQGSDTDVLITGSSSTSRVNVKALKIPKLEKF